MKKTLGLIRAPQGHWVGDGFPVRSLFSYQNYNPQLSPFLLLDYAGPAHFDPAPRPRGVGAHPHRGFETVTIVYQGEVAHRDSTGQSGTIGPGDVQWMTAASGILHEEFHSPAFTARGGALEMVQLWVNLPAQDKMGPPGYQAISSSAIPRAALPDAQGELRMIAGSLHGLTGPARTHSPMQVGDVSLSAGQTTQLALTAGWYAALVVLRGEVTVNASLHATAAQMVLLDREGSAAEIKAHTDSLVLLLSGQAINEPVVGYGPFVMNSRAEIAQAMADFQAGRFGEMA